MGSSRTVTDRLRILIVDEGHAGHSAQSRGFVHAARTVVPDIEVHVLVSRLRLPGLLRIAMLNSANLMPGGLPESVLRSCYVMPRLPTGPFPDLIVSSGGQSSILAASLARRYRARWIYCGDTSGIPRSCLDIVVSPLERLGDPCWFRSDALFCDPLPEQTDINRAPGERLAAVLVGGPSRSHRYVEQDWLGLTQGLHRLAEGGWRFLLTTSARTPVEVEDFLRETLATRIIQRAVWWHRKPERLARQFLADADMSIVTQDSLTMISEAVAARKPVLAVMPEVYRPSPVLEAVLAEQASRSSLLRCRMHQIPSAAELAAHDFYPVEPDHLSAVALQALVLAGVGSAKE